MIMGGPGEGAGMGLRSEQELLDRLASGRLIEGVETATEAYLEGLKRTLIVSADTELISAPAYLRAARDAPSINSYMSATSIVQDELGHAHIGYRMLRDLGVDTDQLIYERDPKAFKYPYAFDVPLDRWEELVIANAFYDRAGFVLLSDIYQHTSYGPWKRALVKVDREETFHLRHGERWMRILSEDPDKQAAVQRAIDWMFVLTLEWFGLPDDLKQHKEQVDYQLKGLTNDQLRQTWMAATVPLCEGLGFSVPAHLDAAGGQYVIDCPFPMRFDEDAKRWDVEAGAVGWDEVLARWKRRGPANEEFVGLIQRGRRQRLAWEG
jgi:ring-1,2-phenylacetyl-CoA epoxidase subunit PaaA